MSFSRKEPELFNQLRVFAEGIAANPGLYQITVPDSVAITAAVNDFRTKYTIWNTPTTRNVDTLDAKDASMASVLGICRVFYKQIQNNNGIDNGAKEAIFVTPLSDTRTPRDCPQTAPAISIVAGTPGALTANFRDSTGLVPRGLPLGATMCQLFVEIGETNAEVFDESKARFVGNFTVNPMPIILNTADRGKQATLFARWGGKRNEFGQWSLPVSMTIAA